MPGTYVIKRVGNVITLNDGRTVDLDSFPGNGWTVNRCNNITQNLQENHIDIIIDRDTLPIDDEERVMTAAQLQAYYGNNFIELNTKGNSNYIRLRYTIVQMFPEGDSFNISWARVL